MCRNEKLVSWRPVTSLSTLSYGEAEALLKNKSGFDLFANVVRAASFNAFNHPCHKGTCEGGSAESFSPIERDLFAPHTHPASDFVALGNPLQILLSQHSSDFDPNTRTKEGLSMPMLLADGIFPQLEDIKILLDFGVDPNATVDLPESPKRGWTALHFAASNLYRMGGSEHFVVAGYLVSKGAVIHAATSEGDTPFSLSLTTSYGFYTWQNLLEYMNFPLFRYVREDLNASTKLQQDGCDENSLDILIRYQFEFKASRYDQKCKRVDPWWEHEYRLLKSLGRISHSELSSSSTERLVGQRYLQSK
jgi:hypothetical protein